jgi:cytochrome b
MTASFEPSTPRAGPHGAGATGTRIWDLPTRLFHWVLSLNRIGQVATGFGELMEWHFRLGYCALSLLLFRLFWGFVGGNWSRFSSFVYGPRTLVAYLKGRAHPDHLIGHSPLGALSVFAMLGILVIQVSTGLVADDEISASGPLTRFVPGAVVSAATHWHAGPGKWVVTALVSLHVLAVIFFVTVRRQRLVHAMITGDKRIAAANIAAGRDNAGSRLLALVLFAPCAIFAAWIASLRA